MALVLASAWDEAASGLPSSAAFAIRDTYQVDIAALTAAIFVVPQVGALLVEAPLLVWLESQPRHRVLCAGLLGMACATFGCALAPNLSWFAAACGLYYPASGIACGIAQAALMDAQPDCRERNMGRWAAAGWLGDLAGPLLLWASSATVLGWRAAFLVTSVALLGAAICFSRLPLPEHGVDSDESAIGRRGSLWYALKQLLQQRLLLLWLGGVALCSLMDELFAAFVGIRVHAQGDHLGWITASLTCFTLGGVCGLAVIESVLARVAPRVALQIACWGCLGSYGAWLINPIATLGPPLLFVCGVCVAWHYPIALAQAYRALPGRSTLVAAGSQMFALLELALPLVLGFANDAWGVSVALALLGLQPIGLMVVLGAGGGSRKRRPK